MKVEVGLFYQRIPNKKIPSKPLPTGQPSLHPRGNH